MSNFVPPKRHFREALLFCFHLKKSAAESHRMLSEAYGEYTPSIKTCEYWFRRYRSGDFDTEDKARPGQPKKFKDGELETSQTQEEIAESLGVTQQAVSKRLKELGKQRMQGNSSGTEFGNRQKDVEGK